MTAPSELQAHLAQDILRHVRLSGLATGHHLTEQSLQAVFGTSRGPIRSALAVLERLGVVERKPNRGYYLTDSKVDRLDPPGHGDENLYWTIARDRLSGSVPDVVSETELARRYGLARHRLARILDRIAAEGWIEKRRGHGWGFLPLIDSPEAYRQCYELRVIVEPAAMRLPTFAPDPDLIDELEAQQRFVLETGFAELNSFELFEINARFHETLAAMSGNPFVVQTIVRQNQLRRLVEYRRPNRAERVKRVCREHLDILEPLRAGQLARAARRLKAHLGFAIREKTNPAGFVAL